MNDLLERIKRRVGISDNSQDELINDLISDVKNYIVTFCNRESVNDIPATLDGAIIKMVVVDYNRIGTEGLQSEGYNGASYSYEGYSEDIINELYHERLVRMS